MKIMQKNVSHPHYAQLDTDTLTVGDFLVFDIYIKRDNNYVIILEAGTTLTEKLLKMLNTKDALYVSQSSSTKDTLNFKNLFKYVQVNKNHYQKSLNALYEVNNELFSKFLNSKHDLINTDSAQEIIKSAIYLIQENSNYLKDTMQYFSNDYALPYHSLHVSLYAIHLGHFLKLSQESLNQLGTAGLLHDVGTKRVDDSIKNKESKLDFKEKEAIHQHTIYSKEIVQKNYIHDPYILDAIMCHHEALDGSGYPHHLKAKDIHKYASILSVSDSFDALTNDRVYRKKYTSFEALKMMMQDVSMVNKFHQEYLRVFLQSFLK